MFPKGDSDLVGSKIWLARRLLGEDKRGFAKSEIESAGISDRARESATMIFATRQKFGNLRAAKNPSDAVRPWGLERVSNDAVPATKRGKPSTFGTMLRDCHAWSLFLFKGRDFKTQRGGAATFYDREILEVGRYIAIFGNPAISPSWEYLEYDWDPCADVFLENSTVPPPGFLPWEGELRLPAGRGGEFAVRNRY